MAPIAAAVTIAVLLILGIGAAIEWSAFRQRQDWRGEGNSHGER